MARCIMLYNDSNNSNITLLDNDNNVIVNCMGDYSLDNFLFNTGVESLNIIYKPSICRSVPENGFKIGTIKISDVIKSCVISNEEVTRLADYSSLYGIKEIKIYNFLDLVLDRYKTESNALVIFEWIGESVGIAYIRTGELVEFRRVNESKLTSVLSKLREYHNCNNIIQLNAGFDFTRCYSSIKNMKLVDKDRQIFLSHIPFVLDNKGISIFKNELVGSILRSSDIDDEDIYLKSSEASSYEVCTDIEPAVEIEAAEVIKKPGFFSRLFGKKNKKDLEKNEHRKESGFQFDEYSESEEDEDEEYFSQVAKGISKGNSLHRSFGANPGVKRKFGFFDYLFYSAFIVFLSCIFIVSGMQLVYKEKLRSLTGEYDSVIRVKNQLESNVTLAKDVSKSPSTKVNQLTSLSLPSSYVIRNVDYDGTEYKINIEMDQNDNVDKIEEYLPKDLVIGDIVNLESKKSSGKKKKIYEVTLLGS